MDGHPILLRQPKHANIPYANHTKRDDTLWGSWHWAVSGPIGPNLPVFGNTNHRKWSSLLDVARLTNKETNYTINDWILTIDSLDLKFQAKGSFILFLLVFTFILRRNSVNEKKIAVGIRMFSFARGETENAQRKYIKAMKKRESLGPIFRAMPAILVPSDHRCG